MSSLTMNIYVGGDHVGTQEQKPHPEREASEENNPDKLTGIQNSKKTFSLLRPSPVLSHEKSCLLHLCPGSALVQLTGSHTLCLKFYAIRAVGLLTHLDTPLFSSANLHIPSLLYPTVSHDPLRHNNPHCSVMLKTLHYKPKSC